MKGRNITQMTETTKLCSNCRKEKSITEFYSQANSGQARGSYCKECHLRNVRNRQKRQNRSFNQNDTKLVLKTFRIVSSTRGMNFENRRMRGGYEDERTPKIIEIVNGKIVNYKAYARWEYGYSEFRKLFEDLQNQGAKPITSRRNEFIVEIEANEEEYRSYDEASDKES